MELAHKACIERMNIDTKSDSQVVHDLKNYSGLTYKTCDDHTKFGNETQSFGLLDSPTNERTDKGRFRGGTPSKNFKGESHLSETLHY